MWRICDAEFVSTVDQSIDCALLSETSISFTILFPPDVARQASTIARAISATFSSGGSQ
jgi:hypothetical protein